MSGSGISWAICKSAPCSRQITMPVPHHSVFYRPDALPAAQPTASKHWRYKLKLQKSQYFNRLSLTIGCRNSLRETLKSTSRVHPHWLGTPCLTEYWKHLPITCINKKLSYRRGTTRCVVSILPIADLWQTDRQTQTQTQTDTGPWLVPRMHSITR